jgi:hypothetical protein
MVSHSSAQRWIGYFDAVKGTTPAGHVAPGNFAPARFTG